MRYIFYTKKNGTIVYVGSKYKEHSLNNLKNDISQKGLEEYYPNKITYLKCYDDYNLSIISNPWFHPYVNVFNKNLYFRTQQDEQDENIENIYYYAQRFTKVEVETLYTDYINNIKQILLLNSDGISFKWLELDDLYERPCVAKVRRDPNKDENKNPYTQEEHSIRYLSLGNDLLTNGMYWAYVASEWNNGKKIVFEGAHRLYAMKLLQEQNKWDNRKLLTLVLKNKTVHPLRYLYPDNFFKKTFPMVIPFYNRYPYGTTPESNCVKYDLFHKNIKILDDKRIEVYPQTYKEVISFFMKIPVFLKFPMYNFEKANNRINAKKVINNETYWNIWVKENAL